MWRERERERESDSRGVVGERKRERERERDRERLYNGDTTERVKTRVEAKNKMLGQCAHRLNKDTTL